MTVQAKRTSPDPQSPAGQGLSEIERIGGTLRGAESYLRSLQADDGHWCGELEGDTILESEYALLLYFLGRQEDVRFRQLALHLRSQQLEGGGWANYPGGRADVSVSTKAYLVLLLDGDDASVGHMARARETIRQLGGLGATNSYTKLLLAIFGATSWEEAPAVPPELVLLPRWFYFNIYAMSSWSRAIVVPLSIIWAHKPSREVPQGCRLEELRLAPGERLQLAKRDSLVERLWQSFFVFADRGLKALENFGVTPLRDVALRRAESWVVERIEHGGGLAAIFPAIMNSVMALVCQGRPVDHPSVLRQTAELERLEILDGDRLRLQPCFSPIWDTALAMGALLECGASSDDEAVQSAARWLLQKEVRHPGDWQLRASELPPGGWFFEYENEFYPDCDDTAEVLSVLERVHLSDRVEEQRRLAALHRALAWQLSMQSSNGGWGAFDKDCNRRILELVPFADHKAMIDPPTVDVTARSIEAVLGLGMKSSDLVVRRAVEFLYSEQETDGTWYGRWGSNYIYGTWLALSALDCAGEDMGSPALQRAVSWLLGCQHENGGWGESPLSYEDASTKGHGPTTATQTAWAMMGLLAVGAIATPSGEDALRRAGAYLVSTTDSTGAWTDESWTGTGFPGVFYLHYHLYSCYFPIQALAVYRRALESRRGIGRAA